MCTVPGMPPTTVVVNSPAPQHVRYSRGPDYSLPLWISAIANLILLFAFGLFAIGWEMRYRAMQERAQEIGDALRRAGPPPQLGR